MPFLRVLRSAGLPDCRHHRGVPLQPGEREDDRVNKPPWRDILYIVGLALAFAVVLRMAGYSDPVEFSSRDLQPSATVEGKVLALENAAHGSAPARKEAVVK